MLDDPWDSSALRNRAMQCRHLAAGIRDVEIQNSLLLVALDYEEMVLRNERRRRTERPRNSPIAWSEAPRASERVAHSARPQPAA